jgi:cold shock CspA family protein
MTGNTETFFHDKGYGFAKGEDGKKYFLHISEFLNNEDTTSLKKGTRLSFIPVVSNKGGQATRITILQTYEPLVTYPKQNKIHDSGGLYVAPDEVFYSRYDQINGWEILYDSGWIVLGHTESAGDAPDDAKRAMLNKARMIGANAVINSEYSKSTGSQGNYNFSLHHYSGRAVIIGKRSSSGMPKEMLFRDMDKAATELVEKASHDKDTTGIWMFAIVVIFTVFAAIIVPSTGDGAIRLNTIVAGIVMILTTAFAVSVYNSCCKDILNGLVGACR